MLEKGEGEETSLSYTFRLSTAKLLLDLEDFDTASKVSYHKEGIFKGTVSRDFLPLVFFVNKHLPSLSGVS